MKPKLFAAFVCLALAACTPGETEAVSNGSGPPVAEPVVVAGNPTDPTRCGLAAGTLADERALFGAETAYNVPAHAFVTFDRAGQLPASLKATVRPLLVRSYSFLQAARTAYKLGDVCTLATAVAGVKQFADAAKAVLPK